MLEKPQQPKRRGDVEVGVAIPIGCMVPLAIAAAVLVVVRSFLSLKRPA